MGTIDAIAMERDTADGFIRPTRGSLPSNSGLCVTLRAWSVKRRSRLALRDLTEDQLRDIGLTPKDVSQELAKSFFLN
jgi:uncharacterized protein YjiS (DUF1127 family)